MPRISTDNYDTVASWNGNQDLFIVEQPDGTKVATPNMVKQFIESFYDDVPTQGSEEAVKSGGIKTAIDDAVSDKVEASSNDGPCNGAMVKVSDSRMILMIQNGGSSTGNKNMRIDLQSDKLRWQIFQNNAWNTIKQASWEESGNVTQTLFDTNRIAVSSQDIKYLKSGNTVIVYGDITFGAKVTTSGNYINAGRLPFISSIQSIVSGKIVGDPGTTTPYEAVSKGGTNSVWFSYNGTNELNTSYFENKKFHLYLTYVVS